MCEADAFLTGNGTEALFMANVDQVYVDGENIRMINIFGEQKSVRAKIKEYNGTKRKLMLETCGGQQ